MILGGLVAVGCSGAGSAGRGGPGAVECTEDTYCQSVADYRVTELGTPGTYVSTLVSSRCDMVQIIADPGFRGMACLCEYQGGGARAVGPPGCQLFSRSGACAFDIPDGPISCEGEPPSFCEGLCATLEARRAEDVARTFEAEVRLARCVANGCDIVLRVEDRCYVGHPDPVSYDCALSDEEILAMERARLRRDAATR